MNIKWWHRVAGFYDNTRISQNSGFYTRKAFRNGVKDDIFPVLLMR